MKRQITAKEYQNHCEDILSIVNDMRKEGCSPEEIEKFKWKSFHVLESQYEIVAVENMQENDPF